MKQETLVSIHNSAESLEKSIALIYNALIKNYDFYSKYKIVVFYGHNLSKKVENFSIPSHGSIAFYQKNFKNENWCPTCFPDYLWQDRDNILNKLVNNGIITKRFAERIYNNNTLYNEFISKLPLEYIYKDFFTKLITNSKTIMPNVEFVPINLEKNYKDIYQSLPLDKRIYSIYALENDCIIGHYDMEIPFDYRYQKRLEHLYRELSKKAIISGNSAMFLSSIAYLSNYDNSVIGYRHHKYKRPNRETALKVILENKNSIIEPKNEYFNNYYDKINQIDNMEQKSNEVVALAFNDYVKSNVKTLKL